MSRFPVWPLGGTHFNPGPWALGSTLGLLLIQPHSVAFVQHLSQSPQCTRCQAASGRGQEGGVLVGQKRAGHLCLRDTHPQLRSLAAPRSHYLADSGKFCLPPFSPSCSVTAGAESAQVPLAWDDQTTSMSPHGPPGEESTACVWKMCAFSFGAGAGVCVPSGSRMHVGACLSQFSAQLQFRSPCPEPPWATTRAPVTEGG